MRRDLKFIGWKAVELLIYATGFPFLFIGLWMNEGSDWCHDRAIKYDPRLRYPPDPHT